MAKKLNIKIESSMLKLIGYIEKVGMSGYDPYDIKAIPSIIKITDLGNKYFVFEVVRETIFELFLRFPIISRKILNVRKQFNAKAMGLLASAYLNIYQIYKDEKYLVKIKDIFDWLDNNAAKDCNGKGWGYPFNWQSKKMVPAGIPNGIVTTTVGDSYWEMYKFTGNKKYLDDCEQICKFLLTLYQDEIAEDQICFSYTPIFTNHVHNLNLFVAEFLIKIGNEIGNSEWIDIGKKATNYTIANQDEDGSFDYDGPPEVLRNFKDNYHTGFVIRMLYRIWKLTDEKKYYVSLKKCYEHFVNNFFEKGAIPKFMAHKKYRIDIHSSAEAINCLSEISLEFPEALNIAEKVAIWTIENLQDDEGFFYHGIFKSKLTKRPFKSKISYIRWGEAWMLKAFSNYIVYKNN